MGYSWSEQHEVCNNVAVYWNALSLLQRVPFFLSTQGRMRNVGTRTGLDTSKYHACKKKCTSQNLKHTQVIIETGQCDLQ